MPGMNRAIIVGNCGKDPEIRNAQSGQRICSLTVATSEAWTDKQSGERREQTEWHRVVIFNERIVDIAEKYVHKGSKVGIEGKLQTRKWTDSAGVERYTTEIVVSAFDGKLHLLGDPTGGQNAGGGERAAAPQAAARTATKATSNWDDQAPDLDDEIPF